MAKREVDIAAMLGAQISKVSDSDTGGREQIEYIDLDLLDADEANFYSIQGIEELAANIELCGLQQPLRVYPEEGGRYKVISGHRRRAALQALAAEHPEKWRQAACIVERGDESPAMRELRLIMANSDTRQLTPAEVSRQAERVERLLYQLKEEGVQFPGRMRDQVAAACKVSSTKLGVLKVIREKLIPAYLELFNADKLPEASAYALAKMPETLQKDIFAACKGKVNGHALEQYQKQVKEGLPKLDKPLRCPPDGQLLCTHKAAFLRHDCNDSWSQCWGVTCCMECDKAKRDWSPCASACSKAKAAKSAKLDAERQKEEKRKEKVAAKNQAASEPVAAFWRRMEASAQERFGDAVIDKITGSPYYRKQVKDLIAGTFQASEYDDGTSTYPRVDHFRKFCVENQVSADVLLDLSATAQWQPLDESHWPAEGQLVVIAYDNPLGGTCYMTARCVGGYHDVYPFEDTDVGCELDAPSHGDYDVGYWWMPLSEMEAGHG